MDKLYDNSGDWVACILTLLVAGLPIAYVLNVIYNIAVHIIIKLF